MVEKREFNYYLRLRGLPWQATKDDVCKFLADVNICEGEDSILFTITDEGKRSGDAVVMVTSLEDADKACSYNRNYMGKRYVEVEKITFEEYNEQVKKLKFGLDDCVVRIRGLSYYPNDQEIVRFFEGLRIVNGGISTVKDEEGRCVGEAYVEFATMDDAREALNRNRREMGNRFIEVFRSNKQEMIYFSSKRLTPLMSINLTNRRDNPLPSRGRDRANRSLSPPQHPLQDNKYSDMILPNSNTTYMENYVHLRGLPFDCKESDLVEFFSPLTVTCVGFCCDAHDRFNGECDVYFETEYDVEQSLSYNGRRMGKRYIELFTRKRRICYIDNSNQRELLVNCDPVMCNNEYYNNRIEEPYNPQGSYNNKSYIYEDGIDKDDNANIGTMNNYGYGRSRYNEQSKQYNNKSTMNYNKFNKTDSVANYNEKMTTFPSYSTNSPSQHSKLTPPTSSNTTTNSRYQSEPVGMLNKNNYETEVNQEPNVNVDTFYYRYF